MIRATTILKEEHVFIGQMTEMISIAICRFKSGGSVPEHFFENMLDFFRYYVIKYHFGKEEGMLFDEMEHAGEYTHQLPIEAIHFDHQLVAEFIKHLEKLIKIYSVDELRDNKEFISKSEKFLSMMRIHGKHEERVLYPLVESLISKKTDIKLEGYFLKINDKYKEYDIRFKKLLVEYMHFLKNT